MNKESGIMNQGTQKNRLAWKNFFHDSSFMIRDSNSGYAALVSLLTILGASLVIVGSFTFFSIKEVGVNRSFIKTLESKIASEGGVEDAVYRILAGKDIDSSETLLVGTGSTTVLITDLGDQKIIRSEGKKDEFQQIIEAKINITTAETNFFYGAQVGEGGILMSNNSRINGSVYSGGDITGNSGALITGDAYVAAGSPAVLNESWQTQNADVAVGKNDGAAVTVVDSVGDVGSYNSIVLGSDGFARIAYFDDTNDDLKFARCTNADCTSKNITIIESAGDKGWRYTGIALGSDGFARISYYDNTDDDLKFARCLDEDCITKNLAVLDSGGDVGQFSFLTLGTDGFARVSYYKVSTGDLKFIRCTDADCTTANTATVDSANDVGKYTSHALDSGNLAYISYQDETNDDLKFARCLNIDCTSANITTVDSGGIVGSLKSSLGFGSEGFARIAYFDDTNDNLKFAQCTNSDCTSKNITTIESTGNVGKYQSLKIAPDGFARIAYYRNGDAGFARCINNDCSSSNLISSDAGGSDPGHYNSLALGSSGFGRFSEYDNTDGDLRFVYCNDIDCSPPDPYVDIAQSFQPTISDVVNRIDLYLKKSGNPANATLRLIRDSAGSPSINPADVLATGVISGSGLADTYNWVSIALSSNPSLTANTRYWIVIDAAADNANYISWGSDTAAGYSRGSSKRSADWQAGGWTAMTSDLDFKVYMGGLDHEIQNVNVNGNVYAHTVDNVDAGGDVSAYSYANGIVTGNIIANSIAGCTINGDAAYNSKTSCTVAGTETTPVTPPSDSPQIDMPISDETIAEWKTDAEAGGICAAPECDASGNFKITNGATATLGPKKITGSLEVDNGATLIVNGTLWVLGEIRLSNNCAVRLSSGYGSLSGVIITDNNLTVSNNCTFQGSGDPASYIMAVSARNAPTQEVMSIDNNAMGVIYYAPSGRIRFSNNAQAKEATAYGITLDNNAVLTYESGLQNVKFSSGPTGGYDLKQWKEVE